MTIYGGKLDCFRLEVQYVIEVKSHQEIIDLSFRRILTVLDALI